MRLIFYGVRGSIPTPGAAFVRYGGNTACVHIELEDGTDIVLDSGTGIRLLGEHLAKKNTPIHLLLSHNHWDHIQGFPFFPPIYQAEREINIYPGQTLFEEPDQILKQMEGSLFPVPRSALRANISLIEIPKADNTFAIGSAKITRLAMNHPGSGSAYCINADGVKVTYITDNELYPPYKKETDFIDFAKFAENADLLIHDAQYMLSDMPAKNGWGHSVAEEAVKLAMASNAKKLALYSHDPERTDDDIDDVVKHCNEYVTVAESTLHVFASSEGLTLDFS
ncbi:MBL fold metallo-hydrolase [Alteromonas mediterranea]|jgi:phosphoribosyl 1,2-cyclic phosphodiesterase|uniref:MBL fold metallo-hydrolase n=1 Tax=Alteromonas mediterranea TaxID=314275 RepID=A0AAC9ADP1_9ALTE|nr:MBL fold metallo-hydrolase [Alteromonas mediterranea]AGP94325.1 beta-lactamase-like protein [Alteromonas mediterranea U8]MBR9784480.1 MBL fold metallo-hydrolase [Gammaproteobacteria bacterium]AFV86235.1 beta-lactamase-like protein [Alteromonas mediterranea DE1]AGP86366.1 beta-lactamase-like protein [Alteromonas mediterranea U4]AGP90505.1 beta-lactamase-like protein [Alteromonas mediterranea U7]|tara:strand:- start:4155 stop:4997 length:843 start_codon:yes stop_codon:yes gene_type:complete